MSRSHQNQHEQPPSNHCCCDDEQQHQDHQPLMRQCKILLTPACLFHTCGLGDQDCHGFIWCPVARSSASLSATILGAVLVVGCKRATFVASKAFCAATDFASEVTSAIAADGVFAVPFNFAI